MMIFSHGSVVDDALLWKERMAQEQGIMLQLYQYNW